MRLREPRLAGQRARRPRWRRRRPNRFEHACHSTLTRTTLQTRVYSVGNARRLLLVEKTRGRIREPQTSKRSPLWRLSGRRSCRRLSTSCQTSKRPSAGRPPSCICSCLGADRSPAGSHACVLLPAVRLRCVKSHALLYAFCSPPTRGLRPRPRRTGQGGRTPAHCTLHTHDTRRHAHAAHATRRTRAGHGAAGGRPAGAAPRRGARARGRRGARAGGRRPRPLSDSIYHLA